MGRLHAYQLTGVLAYDVTDRIKLYAGLRAERLDAKAAVPFIADYYVSGGEELGIRLPGRRGLRPAGDRAAGGADLFFGHPITTSTRRRPRCCRIG